MIKKILATLMATGTFMGASVSNTHLNVVRQPKTVTATVDEVTVPETTEVEMERFFYLPFESGSVLRSTYTSGCYGENEVCIGIFATTTMQNYSGIQKLCMDLATADEDFAGTLEKFATWSNSKVIADIKSDDSQLVAEFKKLDEINHERFLNLQLLTMEKKFKQIMKNQHVEWLDDCSPALVGSYYSLLNWIPYAGWENAISSEKTDKQNLISLYAMVYDKLGAYANFDSKINERFERQEEFALDMLYGEKEYDEVTSWMINPQW